MIKNCELCGRPIPAERLRSNRVKYCSTNCMRKVQRPKASKYAAMRSARHNKYSDDILVAYQCRCAICGWQATPLLLTLNGKYQLAKGNEIHHIVQVKDGGTDEWENIILLCPNHHKMADLGVITKDELKTYIRNKEYTREMRENTITSGDIAWAKGMFGDEEVKKIVGTYNFRWLTQEMSPEQAEQFIATKKSNDSRSLK